MAGADRLCGAAAHPLVTRIFRKHVRDSYRRIRTAIARINSYTQEHVSGMSVVQLFNRQQRSYKEFETVNRQHMVAFKDAILAYALYYPAVEMLSSDRHRAGDLARRNGVIRNAVTIGVLVAFIQYSQRFFRPIQDLSEKYNILQAAMAASERIFKLLDTPPEIVSARASPTAACDRSGSIEFRNVWFTYQRLDAGALASIRMAKRRRRPNWQRLSDIEWILQGRLLHHRPGPDGGHRRPHRRRQDHHHQPDDALLRHPARQHSRRWSRCARA